MQIWNKETKVSDISDTIPEGWTDKAPAWTQFEAWDYDLDCWGESFDLIKQSKRQEISRNFKSEVSTGKFLSTILGIEVDCRSDGSGYDIHKVERLIKIMTRQGLTEIEYVGYSEKVIATVSQLETLLEEMDDYGLVLYNKKWQLEEQIELCATVEELDLIEW